MKVVLILGCWGREHDGFRMCGGVINEILDITKASERNQAIASFLDERYGLFDKPLYSNIHTALYALQNTFSEVGRPVFPDPLFKHAEQFCVKHSKCGLFLRLEITEESE